MARKLGKEPSTIANWKRARQVPAQHHSLVLDRAAKLGLDIVAEDVTFPFPEDRALA